MASFHLDRLMGEAGMPKIMQLPQRGKKDCDHSEGDHTRKAKDKSYFMAPLPVIQMDIKDRYNSLCPNVFGTQYSCRGTDNKVIVACEKVGALGVNMENKCNFNNIRGIYANMLAKYYVSPDSQKGPYFFHLCKAMVWQLH